MTALRRWLTSSESALYVLVFDRHVWRSRHVALQLWNARLDVPFLYRGDALPTGAHFKTVIETGWYEYQPALGAPLGQTYHDFPAADNLHMIAARIIGFFVPDWPVAMNLYFLHRVPARGDHRAVVPPRVRGLEAAVGFARHAFRARVVPLHPRRESPVPRFVLRDSACAGAAGARAARSTAVGLGHRRGLAALGAVAGGPHRARSWRCSQRRRRTTRSSSSS